VRRSKPTARDSKPKTKKGERGGKRFRRKKEKGERREKLRELLPYATSAVQPGDRNRKRGKKKDERSLSVFLQKSRLDTLAEGKKGRKRSEKRERKKKKGGEKERGQTGLIACMAHKVGDWPAVEQFCKEREGEEKNRGKRKTKDPLVVATPAGFCSSGFPLRPRMARTQGEGGKEGRKGKEKKKKGEKRESWYVALNLVPLVVDGEKKGWKDTEKKKRKGRESNGTHHIRSRAELISFSRCRNKGGKEKKKKKGKERGIDLCSDAQE